MKAQAINKHKQKRLTGAHVTEKISGRLRRRNGILQLALVFAAQPLAEVPRRLRSLATFAPRELAVRRLGGSGAAFDRRYFSWLVLDEFARVAVNKPSNSDVYSVPMARCS